MRISGRNWTTAEDARLTHLWMTEKLSGTQIAEIMPGRNSRSGILARVKRLGLVRPKPDKAAETEKPRVERRPSHPRNMIRFGALSIPKSDVPMPKLPPIEAPAGDHVTLADRRADQCGWPVNDGGPFLYCSAPKAAGHKRYCDHHAFASVARGRAAA
jgi:hypothetical protein